ncbi:MAG: hypothetical protein LBE97_00725 [Holosporales bacterium]|jgi:hypothetical protein|nr:hypothetical protein [Holosporales bacterium]
MNMREYNQHAREEQNLCIEKSKIELGEFEKVYTTMVTNCSKIEENFVKNQSGSITIEMIIWLQLVKAEVFSFC